jgi:hypothetical protein
MYTNERLSGEVEPTLIIDGTTTPIMESNANATVKRKDPPVG